MQLFKRHSGDERIENERNRIYKEGYIVVLFICLASIIVKYLYYGFDLKLVLTEFIVLLISSLYIAIRSISLGLYSDAVEVHDRSSKLSMNMKNLIIGLGLGLAFAIFFGIRSAVLYGDSESQSILYFLLVFFVSLILYVPLFFVIFFVGHNAANKASQQVHKDDPEER